MHRLRFATLPARPLKPLQIGTICFLRQQASLILTLELIALEKALLVEQETSWSYKTVLQTEINREQIG
jgi:hypothetical protein